MSIADEELITSHQSGDPDAFQELVRRSLTPVYNFVYSYLHDDADTEDATQETFLRAWKHLGRFTSGKKWKPWLFTIAKNVAFDHLRKKKGVPFSYLENEEQETSFSESIVDTEPLAHELFDNAQYAASLTKATSSLRPEYYSVIMLHYHQELTFEEIAGILGIPMNTAKSWHRRALRELRVLLKSLAPK